ncbi:hypothetical protein [Methylobacterium sp. R2-1]|uniref:hypothetical protein n=1 Tax=Methylobacterium sp. R2-1 TaxID=2587064 RepID=UPI0016170E9C|nr:hypothetical protein [Methylobacterium sp. R2-1]MBB2962653.1 hypothetical protein [Methylobacterium sp. R2-1]
MTEEEFAKLVLVIRARETHVAAQIVVLLSLAHTGFDTTEAEKALRSEADVLTALRIYHATVVEERDP